MLEFLGDEPELGILFFKLRDSLEGLLIVPRDRVDSETFAGLLVAHPDAIAWVSPQYMTRRGRVRGHGWFPVTRDAWNELHNENLVSSHATSTRDRSAISILDRMLDGALWV